MPHVGWIAGYVVVLWLLFAALAQMRARLEARGRRLVVVAADYTIQTLYHGLLLFVLPATSRARPSMASRCPSWVVLGAPRS